MWAAYLNHCAHESTAIGATGSAASAKVTDEPRSLGERGTTKTGDLEAPPLLLHFMKPVGAEPGGKQWNQIIVVPRMLR
jgi:hypothetical protein